MNNKIKIIGIFSFALLFSAVPMFAQRMHASRYHYDLKKVVTITGTITRIDAAAEGGHRFAGVHLVVKAGNETLTVYAGPSDYLKDKAVFAKGDKITVTGSRFSAKGSSGIVAREITKDGKTIRLRNEDGTPLWAGQGRRHWR